MTIKSIMGGAAVALVALASASGTASAGGEVIYGGVRQAGAAVPVPAPAPIPEVSTGWYLRVDAAYSQGDVSKYRATDPNADSIRADSYLDNFPRYGFGLGYYLNRWLRADLTIDQRTDITSKGSGQVNYSIPNGVGPLAGTNPTIAMRDSIQDTFKSSNSTALINVYADIPAFRSFTPYVGAGIGFVRHQLKGRSFIRNTTCVDALDCDPTAGGDQAASTVDKSGSSFAGGVDYALATALMAGFTYQVWDSVKLDFGYRWLHLQGTTWAGRNSNIVENLKLPDQNIHELRAGVRFDIN